MILTQLFVEIDDFMKEFGKEMKKQLISDGTVKRDRDTKLSLSEIMTIVVFFHISGYRNFKHLYQLCFHSSQKRFSRSTLL